MDNLENAPHRAKLQVSFIDFVLTPLWKAILRVLPNLRICYENLLNNRKIYQGIITTLEYGMFYFNVLLSLLEKERVAKSNDTPIPSTPFVYGYTPVDSLGLLPQITRYSYIREEVVASASSSRLSSFSGIEPLQIPIIFNETCTVPSPDAYLHPSSANVNIFGFIGEAVKASPTKTERSLTKTCIVLKNIFNNFFSYVNVS